jgi:hypothetical protein
LAVLDAEAESPARRAWLVRGSSVESHDLVWRWVQQGMVALAADTLRPLQPPVPLDLLRDAVPR